jgi:dihydrofolate reductase
VEIEQPERHHGVSKVVGNVTMSLDGRTNGRGGSEDMSWVWPHNITDQARDALVEMTSGTTVLFGRRNYLGFAAFWSPLAVDPEAEPRFRKFAEWLENVNKVVFSTTLGTAPWRNSRVAEAGPVETVRSLRATSSGDVWVLNSASIIRQLLDADELDRLVINLAPALAGGGEPLFANGMPASSWSLAKTTESDSGAIRLYYDRTR